MHIYIYIYIQFCLVDYLQVTDSMLHSLMMRHKTLSNTNGTLVENLQNMSDEVRLSCNVMQCNTIQYNVMFTDLRV